MGAFFDVAVKQCDGQVVWVLLCCEGQRQVELRLFARQGEAMEAMREAQYRADLRR
jgi:hypothetical protein